MLFNLYVEYYKKEKKENVTPKSENKMKQIKRLDENCPWCNKKTVGQDESGFKSCVSCDYNSDSGKGKYKLSNEEKHNRGWAIYEKLNCGKSNPDVRFTTVCNKLKGHKGVHKDNDHPDFTWEDKK